MIRGITFDKQLMKSKDNAHEVNFYYSGDLGVTKGCGVSVNASNDIVVAEGYFIIKGRLVSIEGSETIDVPTVPSGTLYSIAVFEIDLTKTNTTTAFNQGSFKILSNASAYPTLTQQDLDNGGTIYQFEFARFENTVAGLVNFSDTRVVLQMSKYAPKNNPTFTGTVSGITKAMVGLGNVDNTSDANKPVSTAQQTALDGKAPLASPTFIGTATAPTINATSSLQINGSSVQEQLNTKQLKNWIINGGFDVWQRGTSQTTDGYGSDDRWANEHYVSTKTNSRQAFTVGQTEVPNNPTYFSRTVANAIAGAYSKVVKNQSIEDVTKLAGKTVSLSFWAKADANKYISVSFRQLFGTGGSANVSGIGATKFALTTSWQRITMTIAIPSVSGKTIGANNSLQLRIWMSGSTETASEDVNLGNQSGTFDIANVSLVEGSVPVEWQTEAYADVLRQCQRYYQRINSPLQFGSMLITTIASYYINIQVYMRVAPTSLEWASLTVYDVITGGNFGVTSLALSGSATINSAYIYANVASGLTAGKLCGLIGNGGYIAFSAEL